MSVDRRLNATIDEDEQNKPKMEKSQLRIDTSLNTATCIPAAPTIKTSKIIDLAPGVAASIAVMQCGFVGAEYLGQGLLHLQGLASANVANPISGIPVAIILGIALNNTGSITLLPQYLKAGIQFSSKTILKAGIVCVGTKLSAVDLVQSGLAGIPAVFCSVGVGLTFIPWLSKQMGIPSKMGALIAIGTSICGITAITALSPAIHATQRDTSFAVANVVAFGTLGMFCYPYLAHYLLTSSQEIGLFLGIAVHDTSHVLGTAMIYANVYGDDQVLKVATITKLTRNLFLAVAVPYLTYVTSRDEQNRVGMDAANDCGGDGTSSATPPRLSISFSDIKRYFPSFIAGFIGMSILRSIGDATLTRQGSALGLFSPELWTTLIQFVGNVSTYLLGIAMAAVGMSTSAATFRGMGAKPFLVGMAGFFGVGFTGLLNALILGRLLPLAQ